MRDRRRSTVLAASVLLGVVALAGCSSSSDQPSSDQPSSSDAAPSSSAPSSSAPSPSGADSSKTATITIKDFEYSGPPNVAPGTKVTVTNDDDVAHTLTAESGKEFDVVIAPGASADFVAPGSGGSFPYICIYHSNMSGTLKVS